MRIFSDMDLCEQLGSGMKKILKIYPQSIFDISEHFIDVKFKYDDAAMSILQTESASVNASVNASVKLSATQQKIINCLKENSEITVKEIADKLNKNESTIVRNIGKLKKQGIIERNGSDKTGSWKVIE